MKVMVYGAGISGQGVTDVLKKLNNEVIIYTDEIGNFRQLIDGVQLLVLSPGISPEKEEIIYAREHQIKILPEIEVAFNLYNGKIAGITGTNGKTTTTTLIGEMFKTLPVPSKVAGNIGLSMAKELVDLPADSWAAVELSSFQLETVVNFAPQISCILNLTPDHLERHHTLEAYYNAKKNICLHQTSDQFTVLNYDDKIERYWSAKLHSQVCYFSRVRELPEGVFVREGKFIIRWLGKELEVCKVDDMKIFGPHNVENALAAIAVGYLAGCSVDNMANVIKNFRAVEHRLEYVRTIDGVKYYNDSKATNTDSTVKALESFPDGHVILIAGGHDKLTQLDDFMVTVKKYCDELILLGEAKNRFNEAAKKANISKIHIVDSFEKSIQLAHSIAKDPQVVLLSPACSSYDMFKNYTERGRKFKDLVMAL